MPSKKMDPKLVAENEIYYISKTYKVKVSEVRRAISELKKAGKGYRSRKSIYAKLREFGHVIKTRSIK